VSPGAVAGWGAPAGRRTSSNAAITAALAVRAVFRLALRQVEGLIASLFALLGVALPVPDHAAMPRRGRALRPDLRSTASGRLDPAIDSTGLHVARPRGAGREGWRKLRITVDPDSGSVLAEELTRSAVHDGVPVPGMLGRTHGCLGRGDGACAGGPTHRAVAEPRQVPPDVRIAATLDPLGGRGRHGLHVARDGRAAQGSATGCGRRNAAEWTFSRLKRVLGAGLRPRGLDAQRVEPSIAVRALNRTAALGTPRAERLA